MKNLENYKFRIYDKDKSSIVGYCDLIELSQFFNKYRDEYIEENLIISQWMRIKDEISYDIYEGDIVKCTARYHSGNIYGVFSYSSLTGKLGIDSYTANGSFIPLENLDNIIVRGNIFDHTIKEIRRRDDELKKMSK